MRYAILLREESWVRYLRTKIVLELTKEFSGTIFSLHFWVVMPEVEKLFREESVGSKTGEQHLKAERWKVG